MTSNSKPTIPKPDVLDNILNQLSVIHTYKSDVHFLEVANKGMVKVAIQALLTAEYQRGQRAAYQDIHTKGGHADAIRNYALSRDEQLAKLEPLKGDKEE